MIRAALLLLAGYDAGRALRALWDGSVGSSYALLSATLVRATLETPGNGRVLIIEGGGSLRCALVGGMLCELAVKNGWVGIVVNGCVRDTAELAAQDLGVKALATHPRRSEKGLHSAQAERAVEFAGVRFRPGAWLYADRDGIVVAEMKIHR